MKHFTFLLLSILLLACSDDSPDQKKASGDHVWKDQTDTMDRAREVEGILDDAAQEQRKIIEETTQ